MDETGISSNKKYKVLVPDKCAPCVNWTTKEVHFTGIVCYNQHGHCTHVLQPFDVEIASPLKAELKQEITKIQHWIKRHGIMFMTQAAAKRYMLVSAFLEAFHKAVTPNNAKSSFMATGICPYAPGNLAMRQFIALPQQAQCHQPVQCSRYIGDWNAIRQLAHDTRAPFRRKTEDEMLAPSQYGHMLSAPTVLIR